MNSPSHNRNPEYPSRGPAQSVLVTGGSGYLAGWTIVGLLRRGYHVRATLRRLERAAEVRLRIATQIQADDRLSFIQADLLHDCGWAAAVDGVDFVIHIASPMPVAEFRRMDMVIPAREGTLRILRAARAAQVQRVVMTSTMDAALPQPGGDPRTTADESLWTKLPSAKADSYTRSKILAEQEAWSYVAANGAPELTTVLPAFMQGPVLGSDYSASISVLASLLNGAMPRIPKLGWEIVDVRDVVDLHLTAMTAPAAAGQRFIGTSQFLWLSEIALLLREQLGDEAAKIPTRTMPDVLMRVAALFQVELRTLVPKLGVKQLGSSAKAEKVLGWEPRPAAIAVIDGARSLIESGLV
jgi:dihydroflavonol-4-reductase